MIIYKTTNLINGKIYVGQNSNEDPKYFGSGLLITKAIRKYGVDNFNKEILDVCNSKDELNEREIYWIETLSATNITIGYNISKGGTGGKLVEKEGKKGKTYEEYYGVERAKEIKQKASEKRKGKPIIYKNITREEVNKKISKANKNKVRSDEDKQNVSRGLKLFYETEEGKKQKEKLKLLKNGVPQSEESNKKRSETLKGRRPKILDVHPSAKYWTFYDKDNNLILKILGNRTKTLKELKTNQRRIEIFYDLDECLKHKLSDKKDFKLYCEKYYK